MDAGKVIVEGETARIKNVGDSLYRYGLGYITENRKEEGLFLDDTVRSNISVTVWERLRSRFTRCINRRREDEVAQNMVQKMAIKAPGLATTVETLSGGNQQKISVAKWLAVDCKLLIVDEPTVGVDVGAKGQIHDLIRDLAESERKAVILISSDMPEIIKLANRILVFKAGRIVGEVDRVDDPARGYEEISTAIGELMH